MMVSRFKILIRGYWKETLSIDPLSVMVPLPDKPSSIPERLDVSSVKSTGLPEVVPEKEGPAGADGFVDPKGVKLPELTAPPLSESVWESNPDPPEITLAEGMALV